MNRLAHQNRVNCFFDMIGQSDVELLQNREKYVFGAQRTLRNEEDKMSFILGRSAESFVVSLLSDQSAQPEGTVNASFLTFS